MGGDHHHHKAITVPDWRIYKVENCKELVEVERALSRVGLKDPWLRNEVWRFDPAIHKTWNTRSQRLWKSLFRGFPLGLGLTIATVAIEKALKVDYHDPRGIHGHGHGHHSEHH
ncbi:hypothetical protein PVAND_003581 [Polypedilum vanderplanki]|uniref:NADH dehydrogenase [ubiquinone] 1 beta subcomplex subunit 3 n=1 Tax=Polypedilum vanderplanki TaxID=319348 RepID=A0A9J6BVK5_POLVA|nr:hypothetical protein PVAND_003581 [Polypedilum vanderplanki]